MLKEMENDAAVLKIKGQSDISDAVIKGKKINVGEKFSGKIVEQGQLVFIDDIYSEEAERYGYGPDTSKEKTYNAIMGMPIRRKDGEGFETIGVINLHFGTDPNYTENERSEIEKTLDVYAHFIVSYLTIREYVTI
jgi:signal transduction protein with GAF and PtsI domain